MPKQNLIKRDRCITEIINIIKKNNIKVSDIINTYIHKFNISFNNEDKILHESNYLECLNFYNFVKQKNINEDYVFL